jgi:hypothetical protein
MAELVGWGWAAGVVKVVRALQAGLGLVVQDRAGLDRAAEARALRWRM